MLKITVGSMSKHKLEAVRQACKELGLEAEVIGIAAISGQNAQPVGFNETLQGAIARVRAAHAHDPGSIAIGIESGILRRNENGTSETFDFGLIKIITLDGRQVTTVMSDKFRLPEEYVDEAEKRGFAHTTVGDVVAERMGGDSTDMQSTLSNGSTSRARILTRAVASALQS